MGYTGPGEETSTGGPGGPRREHLRASDTERVAAWVDALVRTIEGHRLHPRDEPALRKLHAELEAETQACLNQVGDLILRVEETDLLFQGSCAYHSATSERSVAAALFRDGVRQFVVRWGVEPDELSIFAQLLKTATSGNDLSPPDVVSLLWEQDIQHIELVCAPAEEWEPGPDIEDHEGAAGGDGSEIPWPGSGGAGGDAEPGPEGSVEERSDDWCLRALSPEGTQEFQTSQLDFSETESENVRMLAMLDESLPPWEHVSEIFSAVLAADENSSDFLETAQAMGSVIEQALLAGEMEAANLLLERLRAAASSRVEAPAQFRAAADQVIESLGQGDVLRRIGPVLSATRQVDLAELRSFLAQLGPSAAPTLCDLLGEVETMRVRRAICDALALSCRDSVDILIHRLSDPRWFVVRNILYILGRIAHQGVERALGDALYHADVRVRREAVRALGEIDSPTSRAYLNSALRDPDKGIRILVGQQLARRRDERAARIIWNVIEAPEFTGRDADERAAFFQALGRAGSDALLPQIERLLTHGGLLRSGSQPARKEAALALAWLGTPAALAVLNREGKKGRDDVRRAVEAALEEIKAVAAREAESASRNRGADGKGDGFP